MLLMYFLLRLGKDLKELKDLTEVVIDLTDDPACVRVRFNVSEQNGVPIPCQFLIKVPRYYPHHSPSVFCIQKQFVSPVIDSHSHEISHSHLQNGWSAIGTIRTVLYILEDIRMQFARNEFQVERIVLGSPASGHTLHRYKDNTAAAPNIIHTDIEPDDVMMEN